MQSSRDADNCQQNQHHTINKLTIRDNNSSYNFLVDTGAEVSCLPKFLFDKNNKIIKTSPNTRLFAANGTEIKVYGSQRLELNLDLRREFTWDFIIADIQSPILGADFLSHYDLLVDMKNDCIIDSVTNLRTKSLRKMTVADLKIQMFDRGQPFSEILSEFPSLTQFNSPAKPIKTQITHHIVTEGPPVFARPRRLDPAKLEVAKKEFQYLLKAGICQPSKSPWATPLHLAKKKGENTFRPCGDYRALNKVTQPDRYPVPFLHDFSHILHGKKYYSKVDLHKAFHQVPVEPADIPKTAITTPFGLFEFKYMTFGLRNAAQTFQRLMDSICGDLDFLFVYLDDIIIASSSIEEHREHLRILFKRLDDNNLKINIDKCELGKETLNFLGHQLSALGMKPLQKKVEAIKNFQKPTIAMELKRFLATINFYRPFLPHAVENQMILQDLIDGNKKNDKTPIQWTEKALIAFEKCKDELCNATMLAYPAKNAELVLFVDASDHAVGSALHQVIKSEFQPLGFYSKKLSKAQQKYSTYDRELTAIFQGVKHFRYLIEARSCCIFTDHKPLVFAFNQSLDKASPRQIRYLDYVSQFTTDIQHVAGKDNVTADFLSRINSIELPIDFDRIADEQQKDTELQDLLNGKIQHSLTLKRLIIPGASKLLYCDVSSHNIRPFVPKVCRQQILTKIHGLSHPGTAATAKLVTERFVWNGIDKEARIFAKNCVNCQLSKVNKHTKSPLASYTLPDHRFEHINIDLIGPMPQSNGYRYCLTIVDRYTRWPEAIPLTNITAENVARKLMAVWIAKFGVPRKITTDRGRQFDALLFRELMHLLSIKHLRTTACNPKANGLIERWHRTLKASIMCKDKLNWSSELPLILLGLRTTYKCDINASPAEMVYGTTLKIPGQFLGNDEAEKLPEDEFVKRLKETMTKLQPVQTSRHCKPSTFVHKSLQDCTHVFVRHDFLRKSLQSPYDGPFKVLERNEKSFKVQLDHRTDNISIDRLKPAFLPMEEHELSTENITQQSKPVKTHSGRKVTIPDRFK